MLKEREEKKSTVENSLYSHRENVSKKLELNDRRRKSELLDIVKTNKGFPSQKEIGSKAENAMYNLIVHSGDIDLQKSYLAFCESSPACGISNSYKALLRDKIRMSFAIIGPLILLICGTYSISFDVERVRFTVLDFDRTVESTKFIEQYSGSRYFREVGPITKLADIDSGFRRNKFEVAIVIPENFGKDILTNKDPELSYYFDGASPFRANVAAGYTRGINNQIKYTSLKSLPQSDLNLFKFNSIIIWLYIIRITF